MNEAKNEKQPEFIRIVQHLDMMTGRFTAIGHTISSKIDNIAGADDIESNANRVVKDQSGGTNVIDAINEKLDQMDAAYEVLVRQFVRLEELV